MLADPCHAFDLRFFVESRDGGEGLAMSAESSLLEQDWNCLNADRAGQNADTSQTKSDKIL